MTTDTEAVEETTETVEQPEAQEDTSQEAPQESAPKQIPLEALQKERRKRQEAEQRLKWYEELHSKKEASQKPQEPEDLDEPVTKGELKNWQTQTVRASLENSWIKENPDKAQEVNENLQELLTRKPHLAKAIEAAENRYEEAWVLMNALSPKEKASIQSAPVKKEAPRSPANAPKAAGINQTVDVMQMSDSEFRKWRAEKRKAR